MAQETDARQQRAGQPGSSTTAAEQEVLDICNELVQTEDSYVKDLSTLLEEYIRPAQSMAMLSEDDRKKITANLEALLVCNEHLLQALKRPGGSAVETVASAFISVAPFFKLYSDYCCNYGTALETVQRCSKEQPEFASFLAEVTAQLGLTIESYLIKPVQRLTKYPLFFSGLLKLVPETDPARAELKKASDLILSVSASVDASLRRANAKELDVLGPLGPKFMRLLAPNRQLKHSFSCTFGIQTSPPVRAMGYLFTDLLLVCAASGVQQTTSLSELAQGGGTSTRQSDEDGPSAGCCGIFSRSRRKKAASREQLALSPLVIVPLDELLLGDEAVEAASGMLSRPTTPHVLVLYHEVSGEGFSACVASAEELHKAVDAFDAAREDQARTKREMRARKTVGRMAGDFLLLELADELREARKKPGSKSNLAMIASFKFKEGGSPSSLAESSGRARAESSLKPATRRISKNASDLTEARDSKASREMGWVGGNKSPRKTDTPKHYDENYVEEGQAEEKV